MIRVDDFLFSVIGSGGQGSKVPPFAFQASEDRQGSPFPPVRRPSGPEAGLILLYNLKWYSLKYFSGRLAVLRSLTSEP